jgi:hypothetical protein
MQGLRTQFHHHSFPCRETPFHYVIPQLEAGRKLANKLSGTVNDGRRVEQLVIDTMALVSARFASI